MRLQKPSPRAFADLARGYLLASELLHKSGRDALFEPTYFCVLHSIELGLKGALLADGVSLKRLRFEIGHRLSDLLAEATIRGLEADLGIEPSAWHLIKCISPYYSGKGLEYPEGVISPGLFKEFSGAAEAILRSGRRSRASKPKSRA